MLFVTDLPVVGEFILDNFEEAKELESFDSVLPDPLHVLPELALRIDPQKEDTIFCGCTQKVSKQTHQKFQDLIAAFIALPSLGSWMLLTSPTAPDSGSRPFSSRIAPIILNQTTVRR